MTGINIPTLTVGVTAIVGGIAGYEVGRSSHLGSNNFRHSLEGSALAMAAGVVATAAARGDSPLGFGGFALFLGGLAGAFGAAIGHETIRS